MIIVEFNGLEDYQRLISEFPVKLRDATQNKADEQGQQLISALQKETVRQGAVGATKQYLHGHKITHFIPAGSIAGVKAWNDSPHAKWVERGRDKDEPFAPEEALRAWMRSKGIPQEAFWAIRKAISRNGTIKRAGYDGLRIYEKTVKKEDQGFLMALSDVLEGLI